MCPPDFFDVTYRINPWMQPGDRVKWLVARQQWDTLVHTLEDIGVSIEYIDPVEKLPDMVFTANAGLVVKNIFFPSRFYNHERSLEENHWMSWFEENLYWCVSIPKNTYFEGEGDALIRGYTLAIGYGSRSHYTVMKKIGGLLGIDPLAFELKNPWFYHLDTCFCLLPRNSVMYFPDAFTEHSQKEIKSYFDNVITVHNEEAYQLVCNAIVVKNHVIIPVNCPTIHATLENQGYVVHEVDLSEFRKAGGGAKCLVLFLDRES